MDSILSLFTGGRGRRNRTDVPRNLSCPTTFRNRSREMPCFLSAENILHTHTHTPHTTVICVHEERQLHGKDIYPYGKSRGLESRESLVRTTPFPSSFLYFCMPKKITTSGGGERACTEGEMLTVTKFRMRFKLA